MTARRPAPDPAAQPDLVTEPTAIGAQALVPGVPPITPRDRLASRAAAPIEPAKPQRPCNHGLFDTNARNQLDLFQPGSGFAAPHTEAEANSLLSKEPIP